MSTFDIGASVLLGTGAQLLLARRQSVRNRDRQIQSVHDRTARRPYHYGSITQRRITACLQPHVAAETIQRDQAIVFES